MRLIKHGGSTALQWDLVLREETRAFHVAYRDDWDGFDADGGGILYDCFTLGHCGPTSMAHWVARVYGFIDCMASALLIAAFRICIPCIKSRGHSLFIKWTKHASGQGAFRLQEVWGVLIADQAGLVLHWNRIDGGDPQCLDC
jgi:hypothetical protein